MHYEGVPTPGEQVIPDRANLLKIGVLFGMLFAAFLAGDWVANASEQLLAGSSMAPLIKWSWLLLCGTLASVAVQGLGILAHDAVHKVMLRRLWLNELVGGIISAFALIPFNANRRFHMTHHRFSHQRDADPEQPMHNHHLLFSITIGSFIALGLQYRLLLASIINGISEPRQLGLALRDILSLALAYGCYFFLLPAAGIPLQHGIIPLLLALPLVFGMRAISDHYGLPAVVRRSKENSRDESREPQLVQQEVGGWVILTSPLLEWLWSNVNYHEVHHKFPYLSHVYLRQTFAATRNLLPYAVADGYLRNLWRHRKRDYYHNELP